MTPTLALALSLSLLVLFPSAISPVAPLAGEVFGPEIKITPDDPVMGDQFGSQVGISGNTAVIAAGIGNSFSIHEGGLAYVCVRGQNGWVQQQKLSVDEPETQNGSFGLAPLSTATRSSLAILMLSAGEQVPARHTSLRGKTVCGVSSRNSKLTTHPKTRCLVKAFP